MSWAGIMEEDEFTRSHVDELVELDKKPALYDLFSKKTKYIANASNVLIGTKLP